MIVSKPYMILSDTIEILFFFALISAPSHPFDSRVFLRNSELVNKSIILNHEYIILLLGINLQIPISAYLFCFTIFHLSMMCLLWKRKSLKSHNSTLKIEIPLKKKTFQGRRCGQFVGIFCGLFQLVWHNNNYYYY